MSWEMFEEIEVDTEMIWSSHLGQLVQKWLHGIKDLVDVVNYIS